jgi:hypothetical protein
MPACPLLADSMMRLLKRFLQRLVIFGLGIFSVWFIVFVIFEFADRRLPWFLALAATYGAAAYIILRVSFEWVLKSSNTSGCLAIQSPVTGCPATPSISCSQVRFNSFTLHLQLPAGQRLIGWD